MVREVFLEEVASGLALEDRVRALRQSRQGFPTAGQRLGSCLSLLHRWRTAPGSPTPAGSRGRTLPGLGSKAATEVWCRENPCHRDPTNPQIKELLFPSCA